MRRMSFALTERQFLDHSKTVTRRTGWRFLKAGDHILGIRKGMGLKKGERQVVLGEIQVLGVTLERLDRIFFEHGGCAREGFPDMDPLEFTEFFMRANKGVKGSTEITRIEFRYVEEDD